MIDLVVFLHCLKRVKLCNPYTALIQNGEIPYAYVVSRLVYAHYEDNETRRKEV